MDMVGGGTGDFFPNGSGYAKSKAGLLRFTKASDTLRDSECLPSPWTPVSYEPQ